MSKNKKKFFLVTAKNRKPYHLQNLKARYKTNFVETENLDEAEFVLCIGNESLSSLERESLLRAKEMGIKISYLTEELLPDNTLQIEMERLDKKHSIELKDEIGFSGEEL